MHAEFWQMIARLHHGMQYLVESALQGQWNAAGRHLLFLGWHMIHSLQLHMTEASRITPLGSTNTQKPHSEMM